MSFYVELDPQAEKELNYHIKGGNKILLKKIYLLFEDLEKHPEQGIGEPHQLKHNKSAIWS